MTYTEAIDSLFVMLENVCSEMDYVVLVEGADSGVSTSEQKSKIKTLGNAIVKIATQIWETITALLKKIKNIIISKLTSKEAMNSKVLIKDTSNTNTGDSSSTTDISYGFVNLNSESPKIQTLMKYSLTGNIDQSKIDKANELFDSLEKTTLIKTRELSFRYIDLVKLIDKYTELSISLKNHIGDLANIDDDIVRDNAFKLIKRFDKFIETLKRELLTKCDFESANKFNDTRKPILPNGRLMVYQG